MGYIPACSKIGQPTLARHAVYTLDAGMEPGGDGGHSVFA